MIIIYECLQCERLDILTSLYIANLKVYSNIQNTYCKSLVDSATLSSTCKVYTITCIYTGFEGKVVIFFVDFHFCSVDYKNDVQVVFKTRIYHCNVDSAGNLSLDILKDGWSPALTINKVLLAIRSMFSHPDPCNFSIF